MESSQFADSKPRFENIEELSIGGATCNTFRVKLYGKLHFLKQIKAEYAGDVRYQEALHKEFETGFRLEHPNLVRYVSLDNQGILMEYVDGETLSQWLTTHPDYFKHQKNVDKFVRQLLDALRYLHSHQVLHLDIKPDNIMITHINNDVKLIDLGCCYTDTFIDTPGHTDSFAAPEQISGGEVDVRTDIYAFGKVLELLPNHHIYNKVIARCIASHPSDRYQSADEILRIISNRHRYFWLALVSVIVTILLFVGLMLHRSQQPFQDITIEKEVNNDSVTPAQKDTVVLSQPVPQPEVPVREKPQTLMKDEMDMLIDKAYRSTIATFCDSVFPPAYPATGKAWPDASTAFHSEVLKISNQLHQKYPDIPESILHQEAESRFHNLVTFVFNKMRENGQ